MILLRAADVRDAAVPECDEVRDGLLDAFVVVHAQIVHMDAGGSDVEEYRRDFALGQFFDQFLVHLRRHHRDARHLALDEPAHVMRGAFRIVVRV
jgi:hypothetical protein